MRALRSIRRHRRGPVTAIVGFALLVGSGQAVPLTPVASTLDCKSDMGGPAFTRESLSSTGGVIPGTSYHPSVSEDGRYLGFTSNSSGVVPNDTNTAIDVFLRDRDTGATEIVSKTASGGLGNANSIEPAVSASGRYVAFASVAENMAGHDTNAAVSLDNLSGKVTVPHATAFNLTGDLTLEAWVKPSTTTSYKMIVTKSTANGATNNPFEWRLNPSNVPQFLQFAGTLQNVNATNPVPTNDWSLLTVVKKGTTVTHYLNGVANGTGTISGTVAQNAKPVLIGAREDSSNFYKGLIDEVSVTPSALEPARIVNRYRGAGEYRAIVVADQPAGYWRLGEASGSALDSSGNVRHGTYSTTGVTRSQGGALAADPDGATDIFLRDRTNNTTERISRATGGWSGNASSNNPSVTGDGRYVVYQSSASNLVADDTNGAIDVFLYDRDTKKTWRVSTTTAGLQSSAPTGTVPTSNEPVIARDGGWVAFTSRATNLAVTDTTTTTDVYLKDVSGPDPSIGAVTHVSKPNDPLQTASGTSSYPALSADGTSVAFQSSATNLTSVTDGNARTDVFVRNAAGVVELASMADGSGTAADVVEPFGGTYPVLSVDGSVVTYATSDSVSSSTYLKVRDVTEDSSYRVTGWGPYSSQGIAMSGDGRLVFFDTQAVLPGDTNSYPDIYLQDFGPVAPGDVDHFVRAWLGRLADQPFVKTWLSTKTIEQKILDEGYHSRPATVKQYLIDCLQTAMDAKYPRPASWQPVDQVEANKALFEFVFDKAKIIDYPEHNDPVAGPTSAVQAPGPLLPAALDDKLAAITRRTVAGPVDPLLGTLTGAREVVATDELLAAQPSLGLTHTLPAGPADIAAQIAAAADVTGTVTAGATAAEDAVGLARPAAVYAASVLPVSLTYVVCYRSAANASSPNATCTAPLVVGEPASLDVTEDGTLDVVAEFTPLGDLAQVPPQLIAARLVLSRLATSEKDGAALAAHVWIEYDIPSLGMRARLGFDGYERGSSLMDVSNASFGIDDLVAATNGDLESSLSVTNTGTPVSSWALSAGVEQLVADAAGSRSPLDASLRFAPAPASFDGELDRCAAEADEEPPPASSVPCTSTHTPPGGPAVKQDDRRIHVRAATPDTVSLDAVVSRQRTVETTTASGTDHRVEKVVTNAVLDTLPATADLTLRETVRYPAGQPAREESTAELALSSTAPRARVTQWVTPDVETPGNERRQVLRVDDVPTQVRLEHVKVGSVDDWTYDANAASGRVVAGLNDYAGNALTTARTVDLTSLPSDVTVHQEHTGKDSGTVTYTASGGIERLVGDYLETTGDRLKAHIVAGSLPPSGTLAYSRPGRLLTYESTATAPLGSLDALISLGDARPFQAPGSHATILQSAGDGLGVSVSVDNVRRLHAQYLNDVGDVEGTFEPGGAPFLFAYRGPSAYAYAKLGDLPDEVDLQLRPVGTSTYEASEVLPQVEVYYTNKNGGPTVHALLKTVPTAFTFTVANGEAASFTYDSHAGLSGLQATFSPDSLERVDARTDKHVTLNTSALPAHMTFTANMTTGDLAWSAGAPISTLTFGGRGLWGARSAFAGGIAGVPASFTARYKSPFGFTSTSGPLGAVYFAATNTGSARVESDCPHVTFEMSEATGEYSGSMYLRNVGNANLSTGEGTFGLAAAFDIGDSPLRIDVRLDDKVEDSAAADQRRLALRGTLRHLPARFDVTTADDLVTYDAPGTVDADLDVDYGWIAALDETTRPVTRYGVSLADGACTTEPGCDPAAGRSLCTATACKALKAHLQVYGLPRHVQIDTDAPKVTLLGYAPTAGFTTLGLYADVKHLSPVPFVLDGTLKSVNGPVDLVVGPFSAETGDGKPTVVDFDASASAPLGPLDLTVDFPGAAFKGLSDIQAQLHLSAIDGVIDVHAVVKDGAEIRVGNTKALAKLKLDVVAKHGAQEAGGLAEFAQVPPSATFDLNTKQTKPEGNGFFYPGLDYTSDGDTLDAEINVSAPLRFGAGDGTIGIPKLKANIRDLGRSARIYAEFKVKDEEITKDLLRVVAQSAPAAAEVTLTGGFNVDIPLTEINEENEGERVDVTFEGHYGIQGAAKNVELTLKDFTGLELVPGEFYAAWGVRALPDKKMGTFQIRLVDPSFQMDVEFRLRVRVHFEIRSREFDREFTTPGIVLHDGDPNTEGNQPYTSFIFHAAADRTGNWLQAVRRFRGDDSPLTCAPIALRPQPVIARGPDSGDGVGRNGLILPSAEEANTTSFVFTFLDAGGQLNDGVIDLAVAAKLSPFEKHIGYGGFAC